MNDTKRKVASLIAEVNQHELACRILEGAMGLKRPAGVTAIQALSELDDQARAGMYQAAENAARYICECVGDGKVPS